MTKLDSCDDPNCPACQMGKLFLEFKADGAKFEQIMDMAAKLLGEIYDVEVALGMVDITGDPEDLSDSRTLH